MKPNLTEFTNGFVRTLLIVWTTGVSAAAGDVTTFRATTDDRHKIEGHGYSESGGTETFVIAAADRQGRPLTPRVEREFEGKGLIRTGKGVYAFSATYKIDAADNTTIFQLLSHNPKSEDAHKPLCFVTVFASDDGTAWHIHKGNNTDRPMLAKVAKSDAFTVELKADGMRYHVRINGKHAASGAFPPAGKSTTMRYGAYHHGKGLAKVHVTDATFRLDSAAKLEEPAP